MNLKNVRRISVDSFTTDLSSLPECFHSSSTSRLEPLYHEWCSCGAKTAHRHQLSLSHNTTFLASKQIVVLVSDKCQRWSVSMNSSAACCVFVLLYFYIYQVCLEDQIQRMLRSPNSCVSPLYLSSIRPSSSSVYPSIHLVFLWINSSSNIKMTTKCISFEFCVDDWKGNLKLMSYSEIGCVVVNWYGGNVRSSLMA